MPGIYPGRPSTAADTAVGEVVLDHGDGTVDVDVHGGVLTLDHLSSYAPTVGNPVVVLLTGPTAVVLGSAVPGTQSGGGGGEIPMGPMDTWEAVCTADKDFTTSTLTAVPCSTYVNVGGPSEKFLVIGTGDIAHATPGDSSVFNMRLSVSGVDQPALFVSADVSSTFRHTLHQHWLVTGVQAGTGRSFGLWARVQNGPGNWTVKAAHTKFVVLRLAGPTGATGATGPAGATGAQGPQGIAGPTGATGTQGPQGIQGPQGLKGDTGATGAASTVPGPQGPAGATGPAGADSTVPGPAGPAGATGGPGTPGEKWYTQVSGTPPAGTGIVGDFMLNTATGDYFEKTGTSTWTLRGNLKGPKGDKGDPGATGATGTQGPQGIQGVKGDTGAQGLPGATGPAGADSTVPGPPGATGPAGATGSQGPQGVKGDTGTTGATGSQGPQGIQGPQGPQGATGATGATGAGMQDTGWVSLTASLLNGWTATSVTIRRMGSHVTLRIKALNASSKSANVFVGVPTGYIWGSYDPQGMVGTAQAAGALVRQVTASASNTLQIGTSSTADPTMSGTIFWFTDDAFP